MKKKKLKAMKELAKKLPPPTHIIKERVTGKEMLAINPNAVDSEGNPLIPHKYYLRPKRVAVDNYRAIKKYFKEPKNRNKLSKF